jgi:iduronate 2-sulfatase
VIPTVRTPALDALASGGRLFTRHYVHVPTCGASRCAMLRGRRPDRPEFLSNDAIKQTHQDWAANSLPGVFRAADYQTYALGKITHYPGGRTGTDWTDGPEELPGVWTRCWIPKTPWVTAKAMMHGFANGVARSPGKSPPIESFDGPDDAYPDAWIAAEAIAHLSHLKESRQPWFFAVGFFKPHLPFAAPKRWFDSYNDSPFLEPTTNMKPGGVTSWHRSGEFRGNYGHSGNDPDGDTQYASLVRQSYAAAISYMDAQVGRVIAALKQQGQDRDTIIIVWSDHGFLLGEHAIWGKHCLYDEALRSPLIFVAPQVTSPGVPCHAIVETVDVFPTLAEMCSLDVPDKLSGSSLLPFLADPQRATEKPALAFRKRGQRTIRTDRWRLIEHTDKSGKRTGVELFDFAHDAFESKNTASAHPDVVANLVSQFPRRESAGTR